jgi:predicted metal-binding membrane protein
MAPGTPRTNSGLAAVDDSVPGQSEAGRKTPANKLLSGVPFQASRGIVVVLLASATLIAAAAWLWLGATMGSHTWHAALMTPHHHGLRLWPFLLVVVMWQAMMFAMMTPTVMHWVLAFAALTAKESQSVWSQVAGFAGGYFVVWLGYSVVAAGLQIALQQLGYMALHGRLAGTAAGLVLIGAGLFQFAPFRDACLNHCRNPLTYFLAHWHNGPRGAFRLGLAHGSYCMGCCWALMLTGFAVGVMNLAWMAVLTLIMCLEQVMPFGKRISAVAGAGLAAWGVMLLCRG